MTEISPAGPADRPAIEALLRSNGLPTEGLELALGSAVVGRDGGRIVGYSTPFAADDVLICMTEGYGRVGLPLSIADVTIYRGCAGCLIDGHHGWNNRQQCTDGSGDVQRRRIRAGTAGV